MPGLYRRLPFPRLLESSIGGEDAVKERWSKRWNRRTERCLRWAFGTGLNLRHYPPRVTRLVAIDPEEMLPEKVSERIAAAAFPVELIRQSGGRLPFKVARFDCVVTTWTLCTIADPGSALREMRRVLKPGGSYLFYEHRRSADPKVARLQPEAGHKGITIGIEQFRQRRELWLDRMLLQPFRGHVGEYSITWRRAA